MKFEPPIDDIVDVLEHVIGFDDLLEEASFPDLDTATMREALNSGAKFVRDFVAPHAAAMDQEGCAIQSGRVRLPEAFDGIWHGYVDDGWLALSIARRHGGHGLPLLIQTAFSEMVCGSCVAASMIPLLVRGAATLVAEHAEADVKREYLPKLVDGTWAATICITEADAGSDVGALKTIARRGTDGQWRLSGTKIFISFGDHQLTEGILHIVLARTEGAAAGPAGLRLFAVPAFNNGRRDGSVVPLRIEHKLGLNASPTCVMQLDSAVAFALGAPGEGLRNIFSMINLMRLEVAAQSAGLATMATHAAEAYAETRLQGSRGAHQVPITQHPDVKRNLLTMRSLSEGARVLAYEAAKLLDLADQGREAATRQRAGRLAAFLLPICKAGCAETAVAVTDLAIQVHGGHGYIRDSGVERLCRDARILPIYEGTTGIQAIDLVFRKLDGAGYPDFVATVENDLVGATEAPRSLVDGVRKGLGVCEACTAYLRTQIAHNRDAALAAATPFLQLLYRLALGWAWIRLAGRSRRDRARLQACASFYAEQILPEIELLQKRVLSEPSSWIGPNKPVERITEIGSVQ